jgi:arginine deiminase
MLTMVDWESFVGFPSLCRLLDAYVLTPHRSNVRAQPAGDLLDAIARAMGLSAVRLIHSNGDRITTEQEQWHEAGNVLAIAPGTVIAYERNEATNSRLHDCGIEVIAVPGSELSRGRGGPRCLTCPIERAPSARLTAV